MLKWIVPVARRPEVERERLLEFWRCIHAPHVANFAKPERYRVTFFDSPASLGGMPAAEEMEYDGMAELWFRDWDHFNDKMANAGPIGVLDGFGDLIEPTSDGFFTTENVIVDGDVSSDQIKWVAFVQKRDGVSRDELFDAWSDEHSPRVAGSIAALDGSCLRYTTSHANQGRDSRWDGIASLWWANAEAMNAGLPPSEGPPDPFGGLINAPATVILQGREIVVIE